MGHTTRSVIYKQSFAPGRIHYSAKYMELMRHSAIGKDTLRSLPIWTKQSPVMVAQPDERLANGTKKGALRRCG